MLIFIYLINVNKAMLHSILGIVVLLHYMHVMPKIVIKVLGNTTTVVQCIKIVIFEMFKLLSSFVLCTEK